MAEVRQTFRASRIGTIAGCMSRRARSRATRRSAWCATARSSTRAGSARSSASRTTCERSTRASECGIVLENFQDVKEGDVIEAYETRRVERQLEREAAGVLPSRASSHRPTLVTGADRGRFLPYVLALTIHLHLPENGSLKGKRKELLAVERSARHGASAPRWPRSTDQDLWQRVDVGGGAGQRLGRGARATPPTASSATWSAASRRASGSSGGSFPSPTSDSRRRSNRASAGRGRCSLGYSRSRVAR